MFNFLSLANTESKRGQKSHVSPIIEDHKKASKVLNFNTLFEIPVCHIAFIYLYYTIIIISLLDTPIWLHLRNMTMWLYPSSYTVSSCHRALHHLTVPLVWHLQWGRSLTTCPGCLHTPIGPNRCVPQREIWLSFFNIYSARPPEEHAGGESLRTTLNRTIIHLRSWRSGTVSETMHGPLHQWKLYITWIRVTKSTINLMFRIWKFWNRRWQCCNQDKTELRLIGY